MNFPEGKLEAWLEALDSGKYRQSRSGLAERVSSDYSYCCMGVAGKVLGLGPEDMVNNGFLSNSNRKKQLGVDNPFLLQEETVLCQLNDEFKLSFTQIAAFIRGADEVTWTNCYY